MFLWPLNEHFMGLKVHIYGKSWKMDEFGNLRCFIIHYVYPTVHFKSTEGKHKCNLRMLQALTLTFVCFVFHM